MPAILRHTPRLARALLLIGVLAWLAACRPGDVTSAGPTRALSSAQTDTTAAPTAVTPTATPTEPATVAPPATPTTVATDTPGPSPTPSRTPTPTRTPTITPTPTPSPTPIPLFVSTVVPIEGAPTPVPTFPVPDYLTNVLLLGLDSAEWGQGGSNTDTIIVASINNDTKTASLLSLPRDLWVYVPERGMRRINTAGYGSIYQLRDTILYNFGIPIHYHAQVDFDAFQEIVDAIGGVDVAVSCRLEDWRLLEPGLDVNDEDNWGWFTLEPGIYHMDGDMALWYARSRKTTSDFDRGRRQQQLIRAILDQGVNSGIVRRVPELWGIYRERVESDLDIGRILQLAAVAPSVRDNGIQNLYLTSDNITPIMVTDADGAERSAQSANWDTMQDTLRRLYLPPDLNRATRPPITVEIVNASGNPDLALLAADNLLWHGFVPVISDAAVPAAAETTLTYFAPNFKGSFHWLISWIFDLVPTQPYDADFDYGITLDPDAQADTNYRVVLGRDYDPCRPELSVPRIYINP